MILLLVNNKFLLLCFKKTESRQKVIQVWNDIREGRQNLVFVWPVPLNSTFITYLRCSITCILLIKQEYLSVIVLVLEQMIKKSKPCYCVQFVFSSFLFPDVLLKVSIDGQSETRAHMSPSPLHITQLFILHLNVCILKIVAVYSIMAISHNLCHLHMVANGLIIRLGEIEIDDSFKKPSLLSNGVISIMLGKDECFSIVLQGLYTSR